MAAFAILSALGLFLSSAHAQNCTALTPFAPLKVSDGYTAQVVLNGLKGPRDIVLDTAGNILVSEQRGAGIRRVVLTESDDGNVCVASSAQLIPDSSLNHGLAISQDGKTIFVSNMASVSAYPYDAEAGTVGAKKTVIEGMRSGGHVTRTLFIPSSAPDILLVSRGSDGNIDNSTTNVASGKSMIKAFKISELLASETTTDYATGGEVLGWGLRNSVGVGEDPSTGGIWSVENSADDIHRSDVDLHNDNPAEELNYHGIVKDAENPRKGLNYGYPACFSAWGPSDIPSNSGITVGSQFGGIDGTPFEQVTARTSLQDVDEFCRTERQGPRLVFPAHTAPLDIKFKEDGSAAYVTFHGSWNRNPPDGYRVGKIAFANGQPVASVTDTAAAEYVLQNEDTTKCPGACFRPVGLAFDKKGRLFLTSDQSGEIFVLTGA
ncbi:soluble quino protein glucose dehydrogenase [Daldinia caldariorum]|uniref:soluble quino protein glucose dehydrogenase n=1 Tax=Daldinia caldariorum TaxID=326644 RepID=UPI0020088FC5|nr:soluble quino protein glucose dehydrogenase [Daldinia caldariorum]KAI1469032.1 soluble quino protein glucose dehydrogenase [Daldinia caldariorum]